LGEEELTKVISRSDKPATKPAVETKTVSENSSKKSTDSSESKSGELDPQNSDFNVILP
jgi:hypothetical protein